MSRKNQNIEPRGGYVYILSNDSMPGILKIGKSSRSGSVRADELYRSVTGVPTPFKMEFEVYAKDVTTAELEAHAALNGCRLTPSREFFRVSLDVAVREVCNAAIREYGELSVSDGWHFFDPGDAATLVGDTGLPLQDIVDALMEMSPTEIVALCARRLSKRVEFTLSFYGADSAMHKEAQDELYRFLERSNANAVE